MDSTILSEIKSNNNSFFTIYSGDSLNIDESRGLKGECDFILAKDAQSLSLSYPIIQIVEAKRGELETGIPQCAAQLYAARIYNEKKEQKTPILYGCVTTGRDWVFLKLEENTIFIDNKTYYLSEVEKIIGLFQFIVDKYK